MIYIHNDTILYYGNCDRSYKVQLVSTHLVMWQAKLKNKYWNKELTDNVKTKIEIHEAELQKLRSTSI